MLSFYERVEDGKKVKIEVEGEVELYKDNPWLLSIVLEVDSSDKNSKNYMDFLRLKGSLIISLEDEDKTGYVGSRTVDGWTEFYFYTTNQQSIRERAGNTLEFAGHDYESYVLEDAQWSFYARKLKPTKEESLQIQKTKKIAKEKK
jgi:hypothetical protein